MAKLKWTNLALDDLNGIYEYVALDSQRYADRLMDKMIGRVEILIRFPKIGRVVPEFKDVNIRELIEGNYRIIYQIELEDRINILRIHHSSRKLENLN